MDFRIMQETLNEIFENSLLSQDRQTLPSSAGLVLFADEQDNPIQLLAASSIRRVVKNKFAEQEEKSKRADLKSITAKIYYSVCPPRFRLAIKHLDAVRKVFGSDYKNHIKFVRPWFIKTEVSEKVPFFSITKKPAFKTTEKILGPYPSQKAAQAALNALEDAFKLCRRSDLVNNPATSASCPYLQMASCGGICAGKISEEEYRDIMEDAFSAGAGPAQRIEKLEQQMTEVSRELNFELAAELKKKIEKLSALKKPAYKWTGDLEKLRIVHTDKSAKIKQKGIRAKKQTLAVFVMSFFEVIDLGDFFEDQTEKIAEAVEEGLSKICRPSDTICDNTEILEQFSIISYFLYRTGSKGVWQRR
ncbi:MAG: UvrB/UvrC motif-containing protein [Phycisphaerae bacterium]|nr:UvrB/UvrC motif-containing protein [Phycisphaerae bacterium]